MLTCRICHYNCDLGDLINGVCDDCREQKIKEQERKQEMSRLLNAECRQLEMEEILYGKIQY